jgi:hypothetical protein
MERLFGNELEVVAVDSDHIKGTAFNILFMVWRRRTLFAAYHAAIAVVNGLAPKHPNGIGVMHVVETEASPPDGEARKAFAEFMRLPVIRHFCVTHEGTGFKAASVRAIASGVHALARPPYAHAVHSTVADASRWAAEQNRQLGRNDDWQAIERVMQTLRRMHVEKFPNAAP